MAYDPECFECRKLLDEYAICSDCQSVRTGRWHERCQKTEEQLTALRQLLNQFAALWTEHGQHDERHYRGVAAHNKTGHAIAMVSLIDETRTFLAADAAEGE